MEYASEAQAKISMLDTAKAPSPLSGILDRINDLNLGFVELGHRLRDHADRAYGASPESGSANHGGPVSVPAGLIGEINAALDRLSDARSYVGEQTNRNCNIA